MNRLVRMFFLRKALFPRAPKASWFILSWLRRYLLTRLRRRYLSLRYKRTQAAVKNQFSNKPGRHRYLDMSRRRKDRITIKSLAQKPKTHHNQSQAILLPHMWTRGFVRPLRRAARLSHSSLLFPPRRRLWIANPSSKVAYTRYDRKQYSKLLTDWADQLKAITVPKGCILPGQAQAIKDLNILSLEKAQTVEKLAQQIVDFFNAQGVRSFGCRLTIKELAFANQSDDFLCALMQNQWSQNPNGVLLVPNSAISSLPSVMSSNTSMIYPLDSHGSGAITKQELQKALAQLQKQGKKPLAFLNIGKNPGAYWTQKERWLLENIFETFHDGKGPIMIYDKWVPEGRKPFSTNIVGGIHAAPLIVDIGAVIPGATGFSVMLAPSVQLAQWFKKMLAFTPCARLTQGGKWLKKGDNKTESNKKQTTLKQPPVIMPSRNNSSNVKK